VALAARLTRDLLERERHANALEHGTDRERLEARRRRGADGAHEIEAAVVEVAQVHRARRHTARSLEAREDHLDHLLVLERVREARTRERRREDEEEHDREHGADRREVHAEKGEEVAERERHRERADGREESDAIANGARRALLPTEPQRDERGGEEPEDVEV